MTKMYLGNNITEYSMSTGKTFSLSQEEAEELIQSFDRKEIEHLRRENMNLSKKISEAENKIQELEDDVESHDDILTQLTNTKFKIRDFLFNKIQEFRTKKKATTTTIADRAWGIRVEVIEQIADELIAEIG